MDGMSREEFEKMKQSAVDSAIRSHKSRLPFPDFVSIPSQTAQSTPKETSAPQFSDSPPPEYKKKRISSLLRYVNLSEMLKNGDSLLLLGLILLLCDESADETLILALAYILL